MFENDSTFQKLIYDIGFHEGNDTGFYLKKGFRVIAVEANPELAKKGAEKFAAEISTGQLTLLNVGIGPTEGIATFYINKDNSEWSSFDQAIGSRGSGYDTVQVSLTTIERIFEDYGIPYYMKVDIEGYDIYCIEPLQRQSVKPAYVSVENGLGTLLSDLVAAGYEEFKYINQRKIRTYCLPDPPKEGLYTNHKFGVASSGPFGEETPGPWRARGVAKFHVAHRYNKPNRDAIVDGWYDLHARHGSVNLPKTGARGVSDNDIDFFFDVTLLLLLSNQLVLRAGNFASRKEWSQYFCQLMNLCGTEAENCVRTAADAAACAHIKWLVVEQLAECYEELGLPEYDQLLRYQSHGVYDMASSVINGLSPDSGSLKSSLKEKGERRSIRSRTGSVAASMDETKVGMHHLAARSLLFRVNNLGESREELKPVIRYHLGFCARADAEQARLAEENGRKSDAIKHHLNVAEILLERAPYHEEADGSLSDALSYRFRTVIRLSGELAQTYLATGLLRQACDMHLIAAEGLLKLSDQLGVPWAETGPAFSFHIRAAYSAAVDDARISEDRNAKREAMEMNFAAAKAIQYMVNRLEGLDSSVLQVQQYYFRTALKLAAGLAEALEAEGNFEEACGIRVLATEIIEAQRKASLSEVDESQAECDIHCMTAIGDAEKAILAMSDCANYDAEPVARQMEVNDGFKL